MSILVDNTKKLYFIKACYEYFEVHQDNDVLSHIAEDRDIAASTSLLTNHNSVFAVKRTRKQRAFYSACNAKSWNEINCLYKLES
jgi:hypothetical protein